MKLRCKQIMASTILVVLVASSFIVIYKIPSASADGTETLADTLQTVLSENNFSSGIVNLAVGLQFGQVTMQQVNAYVASINNPLQYLEAVTELSKLSGFAVNQTQMEWALDSIPMMQNGLPQTDASNDAFALDDRYALQGFYYAQLYNYDLTKWNVTEAYDSFHTFVDGGRYPNVMYVYGDNSLGTYGSRYYDESAQTLDAFLFFYQMGISQAMMDANTVWNWLNYNNWNGQYYGYQGQGTLECEAGNFYQIIMEYHYLNPSINITNLITDVNTRFLVNQWNSSQWCANIVTFSYLHSTFVIQSVFATVHAYNSNEQVRLENTLSAWQSMNGLYSNFTSDMQNGFQQMLGNGTNPAWRLFTSKSTLYVPNEGFKMHSDNGVSSEATADGLSLLLLMGIVPQTGSLAIPLNEHYYEDIFSTLDSDLYNINLANYSLTFSVLNNGTFSFLYGSVPVTQNFNSSGVYQVTFTPSYNSIVNVTLLNPLPTNRIYMGTTVATLPEYYNTTEEFIPAVPVSNSTSVTGGNSSSTAPTATPTPVIISVSPSPLTTNTPRKSAQEIINVLSFLVAFIVVAAVTTLIVRRRKK